MRALAIASVLICGALVAACGDDDDGGGATTATATTATTGDDGPKGELSERGIGAVETGASADQVASAFGSPDREREGPGCELEGPNARRVLRWSWNLDDGAVTLTLDAAARTLTSYMVTSESLPTANGVRVGDSFRTLRDSYGPALKPLPLGARPTARAGLWYVGKPARRWQLFNVAGGKITVIQGGDVQICE